MSPVNTRVVSLVTLYIYNNNNNNNNIYIGKGAYIHIEKCNIYTLKVLTPLSCHNVTPPTKPIISRSSGCDIKKAMAQTP